jgi:hypothetical protein
LKAGAVVVLARTRRLFDGSMTAGESEAVRVAVRIRPLHPVDRSDGAQEILRKVAGEPQVRRISRYRCRRMGRLHGY